MTRFLSQAVVAALTASVLCHAEPSHAQAGNARVYVEDSPAAQQLMREAQELAGGDRPTRAVRRLQRVIERYPHKLLPQQPGIYLDATEAVRRRLLEKPALLQAYQRVYRAKAGRLLEAAQSPEPALAKLETVSERYPVTEPALEAQLTAAGLYLERGDLSAALATLEQAGEHPDLENHRRRYHHLQAAAGVLRGQRRHWQKHRQALKQLGAADAVKQVQQLLDSVTEPDPATVESARAATGPVPGEAVDYSGALVKINEDGSVDLVTAL